jgi:predicted amidohydrolase
MTSTFRVGLCQMNAASADADANLATAERLLREAAAGGADIAALPEVFLHYGSRGRMLELASPVPGPVTDVLAGVARETGMWVLGGSVVEVDEGRHFNTSTLFDREGELVARYRKIHLFDVELPGQPPIRESSVYAPGSELVTAQTELGGRARVGLSICYDLRFPELYRGLMVQGAEIMTVPAAFAQLTGEAHWEPLLRARAIEEQAIVIAPAQWGAWGPAEDDRRTHGHSMVVDAWGRVVVEAPGEGDGVWFADVDLDEVRRVRSIVPALRHRRLGTVC